MNREQLKEILSLPGASDTETAALKYITELEHESKYFWLVVNLLTAINAKRTDEVKTIEAKLKEAEEEIVIYREAGNVYKKDAARLAVLRMNAAVFFNGQQRFVSVLLPAPEGVYMDNADMLVKAADEMGELFLQGSKEQINSLLERLNATGLFPQTEQSCAHRKTETHHTGDGTPVEYCFDCGRNIAVGPTPFNDGDIAPESGQDAPNDAGSTSGQGKPEDPASGG